MTRRIHRPSAVVLGCVAAIGGCATFSPDGGMEKLSAITQPHMAVVPAAIRTPEDAARANTEVGRLLGEPLSADRAVKIALLNNQGLQASLAELGIAEADLVQAGRLHNPGFTFSNQSGDGEREIDRGFILDLMDLLTLSTRSDIEQRRYQAVQLRVAQDVLRRAQSTRQAFFNAIAARQAARYQERVAGAAQAGADLARRMAEAGNFSKLREEREQLFEAEMAAQLARAREEQTATREHLIRLLGLSGAQRNITLPDQLPELPESLMAEQDLMQHAMAQRLDVRLAKQEAAELARNLGLTKASGFINVLDLGYVNKSTTGSPALQGYSIELSLPIFDWGQARTAKAQALYTQALDRVAEAAVNAESGLHEAYDEYRSAFDIARRYHDEIVPLSKSISAESLLRYNGMLIGVWELLADARQQLLIVNAAIQAQKDFWLAESKLQMNLSGSGVTAQEMATTNVGVPTDGQSGE